MKTKIQGLQLTGTGGTTWQDTSQWKSYGNGGAHSGWKGWREPMLLVPPAPASCVDTQVPGCHWPGAAHLGLLTLPTMQVQNHAVGNIQQTN